MTHEPAGNDTRGGLVPARVEWPEGSLEAAADFVDSLPEMVFAYETIAEANALPAQSERPSNEQGRYAEAIAIISAEQIGPYAVMRYRQFRFPSGSKMPVMSPELAAAKLISPGWRERLGELSKDTEFDGYRRNGLYSFIVERHNIDINALVLTESEPQATVVWFNGLGNSWRFELQTILGLAAKRCALAVITDRGMSGLAMKRVILRPEPGKEQLLAEITEDLSLPIVTPLPYRAVNAAQAARQAAKEFDNQVKQSVIAAEFATTHFENENASLCNRPLLVIGCSGGVPAALAYASRHLDRVAGIVLIGGGADFASIYLDTDLSDPGARMTWLPDHPPAEQRREFVESWLSASTTDPYHTAAAIPADLVLQIHASSDGIVPAANGELLWERLGHPERWTFAGGHSLLFWRLDAYASEIGEWIARRLSAVQGAFSRAVLHPDARQ